MNRPDFDAASWLLSYTAGELSEDEQRRLFEAAAQDQDLFDQLMEAEEMRLALSVPELQDRLSKQR